MMELKACLFDLDGVIVDTAHYHFKAWRWLANSLGFDFTEHQNEQLKGISRMESLELILTWGKVTLSQVDKEHWATQKNDKYLELISSMTPKEQLPNVKHFLDELKDQDIKIVLGSASKNAPMILNQIDLFHYFDAIIDGNNVTKGKPDPQVFQLGAAAVNLDPSNCVVFEDALAGVEAGLAAGMKVVGIGQANVLKNATVVYSGFEDFNLKSLLKELN
jgi:beta-phosphoglucomutase